MKVPALWFIAICLLAALQLTLLPSHLDHLFRPNLALVLVVWLALRGRPLSGPLAAALLGLFYDSFSGLYLGLSSFAFLLIYFYLSSLAGRLYTDSPYLLVVAVFFSTMGYGVVSALLLLLFTSDQRIVAIIGTALLPQALVNALCASVMANLGLRAGQEGGV
jgi:rod shape-determining protein MreD